MGSLNQRVGAYPINYRVAASAGLFTPTDIAYDYAIGGNPFLSGIGFDQEHPYRRTFMPIRKEQFDNSAEPGEQMLQEWWYRSQSSWHLGTGVRFQEPAQDENIRFRFQDSRGVDPWTAGRLTLLRETENKQTVAEDTVPFLRSVKNGADDAVLMAHGATLRLVSDLANTTVTAGNLANTIVGLTDDGTNYFVRANTQIYTGVLPNSAGASLFTGLVTPASPNSLVNPIAYLKDRLIVGDENKLHEAIGLTPAAIPAAFFTHNNAAWRWTCFAEGPNAIYAAGTDGTLDAASNRVTGVTSTIYKIQVNEADGTLGEPLSVLVLPRGEYVASMLVHNGVIAIGTNKGVRTGRLDAQTTGGSGDFLIEGPAIDRAVDGAAVRALAARDRFIFAACACETTNSTLLRIDTSQEAEPNVFAWAHDLSATTAMTDLDEVVAIVPFGTSDRMAFAVHSVIGSGALWVEKDTALVASGYLQTGNVRFNTLENKVFRYVNIRTDGALEGPLAISYIAPGGSEVPLVTIGTGSAGFGDVLVVDAPFQFVSFRFTLQRQSGIVNDKGASMIGWQVKALPWTERITAFEIPLLCFDFEKDKYDVLKGHRGSALARLETLENTTRVGGPVVFQDFITGKSFVTIVENYEFEQVFTPEKKSGFGGVATFRLRVVT